jgi:hypothetical protein
MSGTNQSDVVVTLRNPLDKNKQITYYIEPNGTILSGDWIEALEKTLKNGNLLEKNFCFMGFPSTPRNVEYLCNKLNEAVETINKFDFTHYGLKDYIVEEWFHPNTVRFPDTYSIETRNRSDSVDEHLSRRLAIGLHPKHTILNQLHNHFEVLQGTVGHLSEYYKVADYETKYAIRQLNIICHELESLILSQRKAIVQPEWIRPSQITTFLHAERYPLKRIHYAGFWANGYDRKFGHVYMHWAQIGKTLFEVFRDEGAPDLTDTVCEAIGNLEYYSGEFDIEWGQDVTRDSGFAWHNKEQEEFVQWLVKNKLDPDDLRLSLGYLEIGKVDLLKSFGTESKEEIWEMLGRHLDIYKIEVNGVSQVYDYCWSDEDAKQRQINAMRPGYDYSGRN